MTELIEIARSGHANIIARFSGLSGGNMNSCGPGMRIRHLPRHEKDEFLGARCQH